MPTEIRNDVPELDGSTALAAGDDDSLDDDMIADVIDLETQKRLWLRALLSYATLDVPAEGDVPKAVHTAAVRCRTAALDRAARILRSDVVDSERRPAAKSD
jgi:hypothetical protein